MSTLTLATKISLRQSLAPLDWRQDPTTKTTVFQFKSSPATNANGCYEVAMILNTTVVLTRLQLNLMLA